MKIRNEWMTDNEYFGEDYPKNLVIDKVVERFEIQKDDSLEGKDVIIKDDDEVYQERIVVQNHGSMVNQTLYDKKIHFYRNSKIQRGSLIEFEDKEWIVVTKIYDNLAYKTSSIVEVNSYLNLLIDGEINEIPIVVEPRVNSLNLDSNEYLEMPSGYVRVRTSNNELSKNINRDQVYKIGERNNWRINDIDDISEPGLLVMEIEYSQESQPEYEFTIELENNEIELETNSEYQTNATVKVNDETVEDADLVYESSNESIAAVDEDGLVTTYEELGEVEITVRLASDESVYETLGINVVEESEVTYSATIIGSSEIAIDTTEEYVCEFKADGSEYEDTAVFYLENIDGEAEIVEEYEDKNKVVVKGTSVGKVELYAENSDGSVVSDRFEIDIRSLF